MADWDTQLFDCGQDWKVFLISCCCCPCQLAFQKAAVEGHGCSLVDLFWTLCCAPCCAIGIRGKMRAKYGIPGSTLMDAMWVWCCLSCAVSQQTRQLDIKGEKPAGMFMSSGVEVDRY